MAGLMAIGFVGTMLKDAGVFRQATTVFSGSCQVIRGVVGPEDMELDSASGLVFISSDHRPEKDEATLNGALFILKPGEVAPQRITPEFEFDFHPHGISIVNLAASVRIFVINHRRTEGTIEVFDWDFSRQTLVHVKTIRDPSLLNNHNDVVAIDGERFFVSLEQGSENKLLRKLESYTRWGRGQILYFDGNQFSRAAGGLSYANGLALSPDKKNLYVAEMLAMRVSQYEHREGALHFVDRFPVEMGPDNISVATNGDLWIAGHPKLFAILRHQHDHQAPSPSKVLVIKANGTSSESSSSDFSQTIYSDDGGFHSAASIALPMNETHFLLGTIYAEQILNCRR